MASYRKLVVIVLLILLIGGGLAIWNAERKSSPPEEAVTDSQSENASSMVGKRVSFIVTEGEVKKWKLEAETAVYNDTRTEANLTQVKGEFYNQAGQPVLRFTAPKGKYTNQNNAVTLVGGVVAKAIQNTEDGQGGELRAPQMVWNAKTSRVTATGGAELLFPQGKSTADTCRFTLDFSNVSLSGNVTSSITAP